MTKLKIVKPFARIAKGRISTVYDTITGVNAMLVECQLYSVTRMKEMDILVSHIVQENECDRSMRGCPVTILRQLKADGLSSPECDHSKT